MRYVPPDVYRYVMDDIDSGKIKYDDVTDEWKTRLSSVGYTPPKPMTTEPVLNPSAQTASTLETPTASAPVIPTMPGGTTISATQKAIPEATMYTPQKPATSEPLLPGGTTLSAGTPSKRSTSFKNLATNFIEGALPMGLVDKGLAGLGFEKKYPNAVPEEATLGENIAKGAGSLAGSLIPVAGLYGTVGKAAASLVPKTVPSLIQKAVPGATAGAIYGAGSAALEGEPLPGIARSAAQDAALFGGGDVGLNLAIKGAGALAKTEPVSRALGNMGDFAKRVGEAGSLTRGIDDVSKIKGLGNEYVAGKEAVPEALKRVISNPGSSGVTRTKAIDIKDVPKINRLGDSLPSETAAPAAPTPSVPESSVGADKFRLPEKMADIGDGEKVRSFQVSAAKAPITDDMTRAGLAADIYPGGPGSYTPITLREMDNYAKKVVSDDIEKAFRYVTETNDASALQTATGIRLIEKYQNAHNYDRAIDVAESLASRLTAQGQAISAANIMGNLSPEGVLVFAQRQIKKINNENKLRRFGLGKYVELTKEGAKSLTELSHRIRKAKDPNARIEAEQEMQATLNDLRPAGIGRKIATLQTIGQLWNPKTQIRNIMGNELFYRLERLNKYPASLIDWSRSMLTGADRTVTFATAGQGGFFKGFMKGFDAGWKGVSPQGLQTQYDLGPGLAFDKNSTNPATRFASFMERSLWAVMKGFDHAAYNRAYNQTIGELATLKAMNTHYKPNKHDIERVMREMDANMADIADQYGKYVTFQDDNVISVGLTKLKRGLNLGQDFGLGDMVLKYPRTPGALVARGLEYSPAGFLKAAYQVAEPFLTKKPINEREVTMALSRAITGTAGLTGLGYFLADAGVITGSAAKDKDLREIQRQAGEGQFRVNLSALSRWVGSGFDKSAARAQQGDKLITYDWAQPVAMSFSMGANMAQNVANADNAMLNASSVAAGSMEGALNTIAEQPVLEGVSRLFQGYDLGENLTQTAKSVPASFTPTLSNQVRQAASNQARVTYDPSWAKESINMAQNKIPGLAGLLPKAYDSFGREKEIYQGGSNNLFNVFLNPSFTTSYNLTPEAKMVIDIFKDSGSTDHIPRVVGKNFSVSGQKFQLTPDEYSQLQQIVGEETLKGISRISPSLSQETQEKRIVNVLNKAGADGKAQILKQRGVRYKRSGDGFKLLN